jgi:hypothetical protein
MIGSILILIGLIGVIKCEDQPDAVQASSRLIGNSAKPPTEMLYNVLRLG